MVPRIPTLFGVVFQFIGSDWKSFPKILFKKEPSGHAPAAPRQWYLCNHLISQRGIDPIWDHIASIPVLDRFTTRTRGSPLAREKPAGKDPRRNGF